MQVASKSECFEDLQGEGWMLWCKTKKEWEGME